MAANRRLLKLSRLRSRLRNGIWGLKRQTRRLAFRHISRRDLELITSRGWPIRLTLFENHAASAKRPLVLVVPGLGQPRSAFERWNAPFHLAELADMGVVAACVDLSGKGDSWGVDDFGGPQQQKDVVVSLSELLTIDQIDARRVGIISYSLGCAAVAGALCLEDCPRVDWWIDIEGPSDREIITSGGRMMDPASGHGLHDDAYWHPREAVRWLPHTNVRYVRVQTQVDHAQPGEFRHATRMLEAAARGNLAWFQLNDHLPGEIPPEPAWLPASRDKLNHWLRTKIQTLLNPTDAAPSTSGEEIE